MTPVEHARLAAAANSVDFDEPVVVQDTNNVVVWLRPAPVIAKVGRWAHSAPGMQREHAVASQLADLDAPVAKPFGAPFTDNESSMVTTLWTRISVTDNADDVDPATLAGCLATVHQALAHVSADVPDFRDAIDLAAQFLNDDTAMERIPSADVNLLRTWYERLRSEIDDTQLSFQRIHGEPHTGNFLISDTGAHLIDFETVCLGPIEWDLASLPEDVAADFDDVDASLHYTLRVLNSIRVATWCATSPAESMHRIGRHHLGIVRAASLR